MKNELKYFSLIILLFYFSTDITSQSQLYLGFKNTEANYVHLNTERPEWANTEIFNSYEKTDFDTFWQNKINTLPTANALWDGGNIPIGGGISGIGAIQWNGATSTTKKPLLVVLPSAGSAPKTTIFPSNNNFIVASAMHQNYTNASIEEHIEAALAIQQLIRNVLASGKCDSRVFVAGKSQGGGMSLITAALSSQVIETFVSVPAMTGYTGSGGNNGAWPNYDPNTNQANYLDACNHAKRINTPVTFSLGFHDNVTWYRGQNTAAKNILNTNVYLYHNTNGHDDGDWWQEGTQWLTDILSRNVLHIENNTLNTSIKIFPNPASESITIKSEAELVKITIYNLQGQLLLQFQNYKNPLSISKLKKGVYVVHIIDSNNNNYSRKVLKY